MLEKERWREEEVVRSGKSFDWSPEWRLSLQGGGSGREHPAGSEYCREAYPGGDVRVEFPIDPESFFIKDTAARAELMKLEVPERMAV